MSFPEAPIDSIDSIGDDLEVKIEPLNRRRRAGHIRTRVSRARDRCKSRKTRCSGKWPCVHCSKVNRPCAFTAEYRRGRLPSIEAADDLDGEILPSPISVEQPEMHLPAPPLPVKSTQASAVQSSRNSPEPAQVDQQGHYVGPASGASFLLRIQRRLQQQMTSSEVSIFTFGDLPLPETDASVLVLPPKTEADWLLGWYFEYVSATHRFLHRPTVQNWLDELYETNGMMKDRAAGRSRKAVVYMVMAEAHMYNRSGDGRVDPELSAIYYSAAEDQLAGEKGAVRLPSVMARLMQCFYLLPHSRLNHCWTLFGTTAHLALALGIHRRRLGEAHYVDYVDAECRKRTFWCMYNLDVYLSAVLGRPRTFHDDDIDQEIPMSIDDSHLHSRQMDLANLPNSTQSLMSGAVAHFKLCRIVANILKDFYGIRSRSTESQLKLAEVHAASLTEWRKGIAYLLDTTGVDSSLFLPVFLRQRNVLNLAFSHARILLNRPFLLSSFASLSSTSQTLRRPVQNAADIQRNGERCLEAAMAIVRLVDGLHKNGQLQVNFWFTHYYAFCAVVILYVHAIQRRTSPLEDFLYTLRPAFECQSQIASRASPGSLSQRYGVVLGELRLELFRHRPNLGELFPDIELENVSAPLMSVGQDGVPLVGGMGEDVFLDQSPSSSIAQMTGWERFDSLVSGGLAGGWDSMLSDYPVDGWDLPGVQ